jgi:hypothetical protein
MDESGLAKHFQTAFLLRYNKRGHYAPRSFLRSDCISGVFRMQRTQEGVPMRFTKNILVLTSLFLFSCNDSLCENAYYIINQSGPRILIKPVINGSLGPPITNWTDISTGDTGCIYKVTRKGTTSPSTVFSELDLQITDTGDTTNIEDTIKPIYDSLWIRSIDQSKGDCETDWFFSYQCQR